MRAGGPRPVPAFWRQEPTPRGRFLPPEAGWRRLSAAAVAALVLAGACGGDHDAAVRSSAGATTTSSAVTTTAVAATTAPGAPTSTTTTKSGRPATTAAGRITTTTTASRTGASAAASGFTPPGTYRYATTGSFTSSLAGTEVRNGEAVLTVDPPAGTDQHSVRTSFSRTTDEVLRLQGGDALLVSLRLVDQGIDKEVRPSPPGLALPGDAGPGSHWSWRAVSTDARTTVDSSFRVLRSEDVTVGSDRVPALVVEVVLTITGDIVSTSRQTLWVSTGRRLVVRQDDTTQGTFGVITFSGSSSDTLKSLTPG